MPPSRVTTANIASAFLYAASQARDIALVCFKQPQRIEFEISGPDLL